MLQNASASAVNREFPRRVRRRCFPAFIAGLLPLILLSPGCAAPAQPRSEIAARRAREIPDAQDSSVRDLRNALRALRPSVSLQEATLLSARAHVVSRQLARDYRVVGSPHFQNFLVNTGFKKRGLCFHWTQDLLGELQGLRLATLELHWADARAGTLREHNSIVVTARGQPFGEGIVLDAWRHSGRLFWAPVRTDHYPWKRNGTG